MFVVQKGYDDFLCLPLRVSRGRFRNYCYVAYQQTSSDAVLIDPAWQPDAIERGVNERRLMLRAVLLTHHHPDHVDLAEYFAVKWEVPVFMATVEIDCYGFRCAGLQGFSTEDELSVGGMAVRPISTPGHTAGSTCYLLGAHCYTGDVLFTEGCGLCVGKGSDAREMFYSLQKLKRVLGDRVAIHPGHTYGLEPGQSFAFVKSKNIYLGFEDVDDFVAFRMRPNQTGLFEFV